MDVAHERSHDNVHRERPIRRNDLPLVACQQFRHVGNDRTAMRLGRFFGTSAQFWMNLQAYYDLAIAEDANAERIEREVQPRDFRATG